VQTQFHETPVRIEQVRPKSKFHFLKTENSPTGLDGTLSRRFFQRVCNAIFSRWRAAIARGRPSNTAFSG